MFLYLIYWKPFILLEHIIIGLLDIQCLETYSHSILLSLKDFHSILLRRSLAHCMVTSLSSHSFCLQAHFMRCKCRCFCLISAYVFLEWHLYMFTFSFSMLFLVSSITWSCPLIISSSQFLHQNT